jgi:small subunit ribosomal protein S17
MTEAQLEQSPTQERAVRKVRVGRVISDKMDKTVVVQVTDRKSHALYKKVMRRRVNFKVHDETNQCGIGDLVRIMETRPISKEKHWRIVEIVEKAR